MELLEDRFEEFAVFLKELEGFRFVCPHQGRIAHDVGEHDGGEFAHEASRVILITDAGIEKYEND